MNHTIATLGLLLLSSAMVAGCGQSPVPALLRIGTTLQSTLETNIAPGRVSEMIDALAAETAVANREARLLSLDRFAVGRYEECLPTLRDLQTVLLKSASDGIAASELPLYAAGRYNVTAQDGVFPNPRITAAIVVAAHDQLKAANEGAQ